MSEIGDKVVKFRCPRCGGARFGTDVIPKNPTEPVEHSCRGTDGEDGCGFSWSSTDNHKYFETWQRIK